jgi:Kef-type K+ transport system membrane component KefB
MAGGSFWTMLRIAGFFSAVWFAGKGAKYLRVSSIVLEILVGIVFAPGLLPISILPETYSLCSHDTYTVFGVTTTITQEMCNDAGITEAMADHTMHHHPMFHMLHHMDFCHDELEHWEHDDFVDDEGKLFKCMQKSCHKEVAHLCGSEPNVFSLIGHAGVGLMIFESGMHFDFDGARKVFPKASVVAVFGTFLPLIAGMLLTPLFGFPMFPDGLAVGVALAPTSVGIALKLLMEAKVLQKDFGQLILTAAFVDDILSLIIFNVLFSITAPSGFDPVTCVVFPVIGCVFMIAFGSLGIFFWPKVVHWMEERLEARRFNEAMMVLMFTLLLGYGSFTMYLGTHLWGAFVAGMSFAGVHKAHHIWSQQTKRITSWMLRIFFSCTVAFAIPVQALLTLESFAYGSILGIVACILTKVVSGVCMGKPRFVIGWAMVGRAEFAYLIAEMAKSGGIMSAELFAIVVWSLLYATIVAPIVFKKVLTNYVVAETAAEGGDVEAVKNTLGHSHTMNLHFADTIADAEKAEHEADHAKVQDLEGKVAAQQEEILALQAQLFAVGPLGGPLPVLMGQTAAPPQNDAIKTEDTKKEEV